MRKTGAGVRLITDGDVAGVIHCAEPGTGVDIYLGQGGAPEGVLAAAALRCIGGQIQGRLVFKKDDERERARRIGITISTGNTRLRRWHRGDVIFAATGVTIRLHADRRRGDRQPHRHRDRGDAFRHKDRAMDQDAPSEGVEESPPLLALRPR